MASIERIQKVIAEIAQRPKNVRPEEIEWVANQLEQFYRVTRRKVTHGTLYTVDKFSFQVSRPKRGHSQVKQYCVALFIDAMTNLGLYEE